MAVFTHAQLRVLIFAKDPVPGRVKTRLIPAVGAWRAMRLYRHMLREVVARAAGIALAPVEIHVATEAAHPWLRALARTHGARVRPQVEGDLGRRMAHAARRALRDADAVILIGADGVGLGTDDLRAAAAMLVAGADTVLGPADDGGYVLLGLRPGFDGRVFQGIPWGGARVAARTRARLRGVDCRELPSRPDLDTPRDLRRWLRARAAARGGGSHL